jgi:hypothetical protein
MTMQPIKPSELAIKIYEYKEANPHLSFYDVCANFNLISSIGMTLYGKAKVYFDKRNIIMNNKELLAKIIIDLQIIKHDVGKKQNAKLLYRHIDECIAKYTAMLNNINNINEVKK